MSMTPASINTALNDLDCLGLSYTNPTLRYLNEQLWHDCDSAGWHFAIAGSNDVRDWAQNFTAFRFWKLGDWWHFHQQIPGTKYKATSGYVEAAKNIVGLIEPRIADKSKPIHLFGHSKGGAVASVVGLILYAQGYNVQPVRTYGAPRYSIELINSKPVNQSVQYAARGDVVPEYPEAGLIRSWTHQGQLVRVGQEVNKRWGVVRDAIEAHLLPNYRAALEFELSLLERR